MSIIVKYNKLFKTLEEKGPATSVLLLYGEEDYLKKVTIEKIEKFLNTKRIVFFGQETPEDHIRAELLSSGLFQSKKLIVVYEFERLKDREKLFSLPLNSGTFLICIVSSHCDKKKQKDIIQKARKYKHVQIIEFKPLDEMGFRAWIKSRFKKRNIHIDDSLLLFLQKLLPQNLTQAAKELEKLFLFMGEDTILQKEHLAILSGQKAHSLSSVLIEHMGFEKKYIRHIFASIDTMKTNEALYETETHIARIHDVHLGTFFSDKYRNKWKLSPYKKNKMIHTLKDASVMMRRLLEIEYTTKTSLHNERITKALIILSLLP